MFKHCSSCQLDIPAQFWSQHMQQHKQARPGARNGQTASPGLKRKVKVRDQGKCRQCQSVSQLQVHHVNGIWTDNRMENLLTLCWRCHLDADAELRRQTREVRSRMAPPG